MGVGTSGYMVLTTCTYKLEPCTGRRNMVEFLMAAHGSCATILWVIAAVLVIAGIITLLRGGVLAGIALIIIGLLIGPGGVSIFSCG
jgi:hypothetical protein